MKGKRLITLTGGICLILVLAALSLTSACAKPAATPTPTPPAKPIVLNLATWTPDSPTDFRTVSVRWFADQVKERSNGRLVIEVFPAQTLCKAKEELTMVSEGNIDMAAPAGAYYIGIVPILDCTNLPFSCTTEKLDTFYTRAHDILTKHLAEQDVKYLWSYEHGLMQWWMRDRFIKSPADFGGMKIRLSGGYFARAGEIWGSAPVSVSASESYMALQRGTVDGILISMTSYLSFKMHEVAPYATICNYMSGGSYVVINKDKWDTIPADLQKIMFDTGKEAQKHSMELMAESDEGSLDKLPGLGVKTYYLTPEERQVFVDSGEVLWDDFAAKGPDFKALVEILRELRE